MSVETRSDTVKTSDGAMPVHVARRKGVSGKLPAVIVVQEAFGLNHNITEIAERIAAEGYQAMAPNFYYREGGKVVTYAELQEAIGLMTRWTDAHIVTDVHAVVAALGSDGGVRADRIGITGFCMGGRATYLAACEVAAIRAAVTFYGGGIAGQQFGPGASAPVALTGKMKAAIQLHFGDKDSYIPPTAVEEIRQALERADKDYEIHVYKGAGHGFFCRDRADYNEEAVNLAWERTKTFFKKHLQQ